MKKSTILLITFIMILILGGCNGKTKDSTSTNENTKITNENSKVVKVGILEQRNLSESATLSGDVISDNTEVISAVISGTIENMIVNVGDIVKQNDTIAKLNDEWLNLQSQQANIQYDNAKIQLESANRTYERINSLYQNGAVTRSEYEKTSDALKAAQLGFKSAQNSKNQMNYQLKNIKIKAPINGTISQVFQKTGSAVAAGTPICEIINTEDMIVSTGIAEDQVGVINQNQEVEIQVPAINQTFSGTVQNIGPSPNIDKKYPVRIHINNPSQQLKIGMFAQLKIDTITSHTALAIPKTAIVSEEGEDYIFIVNQDKATKKSVELGATFEDYFEIKSGAVEGDTIVISGQNYLANGDTIRIVD